MHRKLQFLVGQAERRCHVSETAAWLRLLAPKGLDARTVAIAQPHPLFPPDLAAWPCIAASAGTREAEENKIRLGLIDAASRAVSGFYLDGGEDFSNASLDFLLLWAAAGCRAGNYRVSPPAHTNTATYTAPLFAEQLIPTQTTAHTTQDPARLSLRRRQMDIVVLDVTGGCVKRSDGPLTLLALRCLLLDGGH